MLRNTWLEIIILTNLKYRSWISHHQNRSFYFHIFRFIYFFKRKPILEYNKYAELIILANIFVANGWSFIFYNDTIFLPTPVYCRKTIQSEQQEIHILYYLIDIYRNFIFFHIINVHPSLWPELLRKVFNKSIIRYKATSTYSIIFKQNPEAMELLKIPNIYYIPSSFILKMFVSLCILIFGISGRNTFPLQIINKFIFSSDLLGNHLSHAVHFSETVRTPHCQHPRTAKKVPKSSDNPGISNVFIYLPLFILNAFVFDFCLEKQLLCPDIKRINFQDEPFIYWVLNICKDPSKFLGDGSYCASLYSRNKCFYSYPQRNFDDHIFHLWHSRHYLPNILQHFLPQISLWEIVLCVLKINALDEDFKKVLKKWKSCSVLHKILFFKCKKMWIKFNESKFNCLLEKGQKSRLIDHNQRLLFATASFGRSAALQAYRIAICCVNIIPT
uniref:Signal peptide protein n=1 Tax=Heterorhabditis bacteriophora TaxID=37862 RepID=A0A1I7WJQ0_HETBA